MTTSNEYGEMVLMLAGCDCHPHRIVQILDDSGAFTVKHEHQVDCAKTLNGQYWHERVKGLAAPDVMTETERRQRRVKYLGAS